VPPLPIDRHTLDNGLRVVLSQDDRAPIVAVNLWYAVGSGHEEVGKTGFAHLFEHMMFQGSLHVGKGEHVSLVQGAGGTLNAGTDLDYTSYYETLPSHELELALWLEADRMASLHSAMTQEKLDNQRDVVKNERRWRVDNQPYGDWEERLQALVFPESHPYHHPTLGSMEDLGAASLDDVRTFFATWYVPNNTVLTIAGDFEPAAAQAMVERHFGSIPANPHLPGRPASEIAPSIGDEVRITVSDRGPLPRIYLAYRAPVFGTEAFDVLEVVADLLGLGRASRLYSSLVREQRLAQEVGAFLWPNVGGASVFLVSATARPGGGHQQLEAALLAEVDRLAPEGPDANQLERVRNLHTSHIERSLERVAGRADRLSMYACLFDEPERVNAEVASYHAVDAGRIQAAVAECLRPDNRVVLTYVPGASEAGAS
jgi:zinc protease